MGSKGKNFIEFVDLITRVEQMTKLPYSSIKEQKILSYRDLEEMIVLLKNSFIVIFYEFFNNKFS